MFPFLFFYSRAELWFNQFIFIPWNIACMYYMEYNIIIIWTSCIRTLCRSSSQIKYTDIVHFRRLQPYSIFFPLYNMLKFPTLHCTLLPVTHLQRIFSHFLPSVTFVMHYLFFFFFERYRFLNLDKKYIPGKPTKIKYLTFMIKTYKSEKNSIISIVTVFFIKYKVLKVSKIYHPLRIQIIYKNL